MRNPSDHTEVRGGVGAHEWLRTEEEDFGRAFDVQEQLARRGRRHRAVSLPDLLLAAVVERHRVAVLHYDADFDLIAKPRASRPAGSCPGGSIP